MKSEDKGRGRRGVVKQHTTNFRETATRSNGFKVIRPELVRSARVWHLWATCCVYFTGAPPSGRGLTGNDTEIVSATQRLDPMSDIRVHMRPEYIDGIVSICDPSILMGCRCMRIFLWWLPCDGTICGPLHAVDVSPL